MADPTLSAELTHPRTARRHAGPFAMKAGGAARSFVERKGVQVRVSA